MAITINTEPNDISPVYSDISYVVTSTNYAQSNFKFVAVVKNAAGTIIAKLKAPIFHGTTDKGVFNISRILQNYVTYDFTQNLGTLTKCLNSYIGYSVEFGEEYGGTEHLKVIKLPWVASVSDLSQFMVRFGCGPVQLNALTAGELDSGTAGNVIPTNTAYYTIQIQTGAGSAGSEVYRFDIVEECSKYLPQYLNFLNPLGGFESVRCSMASKDKYNINRKQFKRNNYTLSGNTYAYDTSKHGITNYAVEKTKEVTLNTNWLTETEFEWLQDLIASPVVFLGNIPVNIVETSYEVFDYVDGPNNLKITVQYTEPERLQNA
ncbi:MAG: hypothetical protein EBR30_08335 [Cytophagia bacterium]|nr:hypothetical protein [Cytophagia bacterium]